MDRRTQGNAAEDAALDYLQQHGLQLVCRNFLCKAGELDLVLRDGPTLAVVEVRSRRNQGYGNAADSIGWAKCKRIIHATEYLLLKHRELRKLPIRFDVVTLDTTSQSAARITWIKAAFDASD